MEVLLLLIATCWILSIRANYELKDEYKAENFADRFDFYTGDDPTHGYVKYVDYKTALEQGLFKINSNKSIYIGVDFENNATLPGRNSVRIQSKTTYNNSLFILDLAHMPGSVCGSWPAFWLMGCGGQDWPRCGAINVIENCNNQKYNLMALHSADKCQIQNSTSTFTGHLLSKNCFISAENQTNNQGCSFRAPNLDSYGDEFNKAGGGVYVLDWSLYFIRIWHFARSEIPDDIQRNQPNPKEWGKPLAEFAGHCDFVQKFYNQNIVFDITFCGDYAGTTWSQQCGDKGPECTAYVKENPEVFKETYWLINSLRVYSTPLIPTTTLPPPPRIGIYVGIGVFVPLFFIFIAISTSIWCLCRQKQRKRRETIESLASNAYKTFNGHWILKTKKDPWEIKRNNIEIGKQLGSGAFAVVHMGKLTEEAGITHVYKNSCKLASFHDCTIAIKMLRLTASDEAKDEFQQEINFMKTLKYNEHLVCFLGYVQNEKTQMLILEYCANGNLLNFIKSNKNEIINAQNCKNSLSVKDFVSFAWQICEGLKYLTSIGLIHRDIAARNVLLSENYVCKICDFGLCRLTDTQMYTSKGGLMPYRWMAVESLKSFEYSTKSDVWSYGVLLFELFSFGEVPYANLEHAEILSFLTSGQRLHKPVYCADEVYDLMLSCWQESPKNRPAFTQICKILTKILENSNYYYGYVSAIQPLDSEKSGV